MPWRSVRFQIFLRLSLSLSPSAVVLAEAGRRFTAVRARAPDDPSGAAANTGVVSGHRRYAVKITRVLSDRDPWARHSGLTQRDRPSTCARGRLACQTAAVPPHRDIAAFEDRAAGYEQGWRGRLHHDIADRTAALALSASAAPRRVLDIGCGTGYLLRLLARQWPQASELAGIDPAPSMIEAAEGSARDERMQFSIGAAERLHL